MAHSASPEQSLQLEQMAETWEQLAEARKQTRKKNGQSATPRLVVFRAPKGPIGLTARTRARCVHRTARTDSAPYRVQPQPTDANQAASYPPHNRGTSGIFVMFAR